MESLKSIKVYVRVIVEFYAVGIFLPKAIIWENGEKLVVNKTLAVRQAHAMKSDNQGDRFTISINRKQSFIWFGRNASISVNNRLYEI